jgi:hypothetical protein
MIKILQDAEFQENLFLMLIHEEIVDLETATGVMRCHIWKPRCCAEESTVFNFASLKVSLAMKSRPQLTR